MPEHTELPPLFAGRVLKLPHTSNGIVNTEVLVVARKQLDEPAGAILVDDKVLKQVEQPLLGAHATDDGLQRHDALFPLRVDLLPFGEVLPARGDCADLRVNTV